MMIELAN